jgi:hypothetical protein
MEGKQIQSELIGKSIEKGKYEAARIYLQSLWGTGVHGGAVGLGTALQA